MHKVIDGGKLEFAKPGAVNLETRHDYYRRCQALRANGRQCKAPAMKDHDICRKHAEQREKAMRAESQRRDFVARINESPDGEVSDAVRVNRIIRDLMQAMLDGLIDEDTAGAMLDEIALKQGLLTRFYGKTEHLPRRHGDTENLGDRDRQDVPPFNFNSTPARA